MSALLYEEEFLLLLEAARTISTTLEIKKLISQVTELAKRIVSAEAVSLLLLDEKTQELVFDIVVGGADEKKLKTIRLKVGEGIAGTVAKTKQPLIIKDVQSDPRWSPTGDKITGYRTKSILCVPIIYKEKTLGVLEAINPISKENFDERDLHLFEIFSSQVGVALENAFLFNDLITEREKIYSLFDGMKDGALMLDEDENIVMYNQAALNFFSTKELQNKNFFSLLTDFTNLTMPNLKSLSEIKETNFQLEFVRKHTKTFYVDLHGTKIFEPETNKLLGYSIILHDTTEEKKEETLKRTFLSLVSHKLRTPLTSILGYASLLSKTQLESTQSEFVKKIIMQGQYLSSLVDKLITFTLIESETLTLNRTETDLYMLLQESIDMLSEMISSRKATLEIDKENFKSLPKLYIDPIKMREVFRNIIENAIKFCKNENAIIKIYPQLQKNFIEVVFEDNGVGIPPEEQEKIFQKFYQIEEHFTGQVEGIGLGLALVKRVVEEHNGRVRVESILGKGSKFIVSLPI